MVIRTVIAATTLLFVVPCGWATTPRVVTDRDSGKTFRVARGHELTLRLSGRYVWNGPRVRGSAVRLTPVNYFVDPGYQEWTIHARARGTVRISAVGNAASPRLFRIRVIVP